MMISIGGLEGLIEQSLKVDLCDSHGSLLWPGIPLLKMEDDVDMFYLFVRPPDIPFVVKLRGKGCLKGLKYTYPHPSIKQQVYPSLPLQILFTLEISLKSQ